MVYFSHATIHTSLRGFLIFQPCDLHQHDLGTDLQVLHMHHPPRLWPLPPLLSFIGLTIFPLPVVVVDLHYFFLEAIIFLVFPHALLPPLPLPPLPYILAFQGHSNQCCIFHPMDEMQSFRNCTFLSVPPQCHAAWQLITMVGGHQPKNKKLQQWCWQQFP